MVRRVFRSKASLFPCAQAMTIGTQQLQIALIRIPIMETPIPRIMAILRSYLRRTINMVDIQDTKIIDATLHTPSTKAGYEGKLAFPEAYLSGASLLSVAKDLGACWRTKPCHGGLSTGMAASRIPPACPHITVLAAIDACPILRTIGMNGHRHRTLRTGFHDLRAGFMRRACLPFIPRGRAIRIMTGFRAILTARASIKLRMTFCTGMIDTFHRIIVSNHTRTSQYFDIACQRMHDAMAQPDLFITHAPQAIQQPLFAGGT